MKKKPSLCIVTPALAAANNGNWQTASRWARMLAADYQVSVVADWRGQPCDAMIALHARRSAPAIAAWSAQLVRRPLVVVLTGTDLYRDIHHDAAARQSLQLADRLVVLHELAPLDVPAEHREKTLVCFQSCTAWKPQVKTQRRLRALMVGHLREEKDPATYFAAARLIAGRSDIVLDHIGAPLDAELGAQAQALMREQAPDDPHKHLHKHQHAHLHKHPHYRWLGALNHRDTRARIQRAHVLVHCSRMEGGAHVVMEAVRSGTPVIASRIPGNVGMLGRDHPGYFAPGDAAALASLLERARDDPAMLPALQAQSAARAPLFDPAHERATLRALMAGLVPR